jgi:processive 1,2-diacylglycerol beta-glucosyltransferase
VDHYLVSTEQVRRRMTKRGFPAEKLSVFPYPLPEPCSLTSREASELRKSLGIDPAKQTLLVSFGGEGIGPLEGILETLVGWRLPLNIVVVCGRNEDLRQSLEARFAPDGSATRIIPLGYIDYLRKIIFLADFCFIKPGPATTLEVMSYRKPILFTRSAQLSEEKILRYACRLGVACYAGSRPVKVALQVEGLMQRQFQEACRARYGDLAPASGVADIARFIDRQLDDSG